MKLTKKDIPFFARIIGVLLIITMCVAALLSLVNAITKDTIAENEAKKTAEAIQKLFPSAAAPVSTKVDVTLDDATFVALYEVKDGDAPVGYYAEVAPTGFKGKVNMLVGVDVNGTVCGIQILSHGETVGIGDKIEDPDFRARLTGKSGSVTYKKGANGSGSEIDGISGATYSSKAVIAGTDTALKAYSAYKGGAV